MAAISLKLSHELLEASSGCATALKLSRAAYIRQAVERMNRETQARLRARRIADMSHRVRRESMRVNAEFARIERDPDANRGEVWLAHLGPRRGTEPGKTRPVLLVQSQALLDAGHPSPLVVPLTTNLIDDAEPLRLRVPAAQHLRRPSDLIIDQLRAIDNRRLVGGPLTRLPRALVARIDDAIREVPGTRGFLARLRLRPTRHVTRVDRARRRTGVITRPVAQDRT
jgi:mRNA interferase MazF